jgi:hypothetical protein
MFKALSHAFYGDQTRWFIGKVVDIDGDPLQLGRVRVNILGIHDNIADEGDLPWASVVLPTTEGGVVSGFPPSLDMGAQVFGIFLDGVQSQLPLVIGSIPHQLSYNNPESGTFGAPGADDRDRQGGFSSQGPSEPVGPANESQEKAYNYFRSVGYSDAVARGIVGNMMVESSFAPENIGFAPGVRRDNGSMGVCQWRLERLNGPQGLKAWAARQNPPLNPENLSTQFQFTKFELDTFAYLGKQELFNCTTPEQAAVTFCRKFERPDSYDGLDGNAAIRSAYRDPPYSTNGNFDWKRFGEDERINYAKNLVFNSRSVASSGGAV